MIEFIHYPPSQKGDVVWTELGRQTLASMLEVADNEMIRSVVDQYGSMRSTWNTRSSTVLDTTFQIVVAAMKDASCDDRQAVLSGLVDDLLLHELTGDTVSDNNFNPFTAPQHAERIAKDPLEKLRAMAPSEIDRRRCRTQS